jgi:hypothetical protein
MGVHRALLDDARRRALAGRRSRRLAIEVRGTAERALALLERRLGGYALRREWQVGEPRLLLGWSVGAVEREERDVAALRVGALAAADVETEIR